MNISHHKSTVFIRTASLLAVMTRLTGEAPAAVSLLDSFTESPFAISSETTSNTASGMIPALIADHRFVAGIGDRDWSADLVDATNLVSYRVEPEPGPIQGSFLHLDYVKAGGAIDLSEFAAFAFQVTEISGFGSLIAWVASNSNSSDPVTVDSTGTLVYPFSNMFLPPDPDYLAGVPGIKIRIYADSPDFSITLGRIDVIPEPRVVFLTSLGWICLGLRRRREGPRHRRWPNTFP